jgi:hypothetical protein
MIGVSNQGIWKWVPKVMHMCESPWFETPIIYDVRAKPRNIPSLTGTKDLQMVNITCRHHLQVLRTSEGRDVARFGTDIVDDRRFEPRDLETSPAVSYPDPVWMLFPRFTELWAKILMSAFCLPFSSALR